MAIVRLLIGAGAALVAASIRPHVSLAAVAVELGATPDDVIERLRHRFLEGDDVIAGDRRRIVRRFRGEAGRFRYATVEVVGFEPNAVTFEHLRGPFADCHERFDLVRTTTGSRLTHPGAFSLRGGLWTWPFALFAVRPAFQRLVGEHLQQLRGEIAAPG